METLQVVFETITGNIFYMILAVALIVLIGYGLVKKLFKLVVLMLICLSIYIGLCLVCFHFSDCRKFLDFGPFFSLP